MSQAARNKSGKGAAARARTTFVCQSCGYASPKWLGRCPGCEGWGSLVEEVGSVEVGPAPELRAAAKGVIALSAVVDAAEPRRTTGLSELDRVLGGGLVDSSLTLVGGDPGIGKSTLLLQCAALLAGRGERVLYVCAEESARQVKMRAERLGSLPDNLFLLADTRLDVALVAAEELRPTVCIVDSVQTVSLSALESSAGSVGQIRAVTERLMHLAKSGGVSTFVVGHVTKDGAIAGPKVMEHMVDTVLYFEGERSGPYRLLRAHKNRFGSAQEVGVFEMTQAGLITVDNPSKVFLSQRASGPGSAVVTSLEGSRPLLLEVQALATPSPFGTPRRTSVGLDPQRLAMLCAVLEARAGLSLAGFDVYANVVGGVRLSETAADLGVLCALASAQRQRPISADTVLIGEVGLAGEVRAVGRLEARLAEAASLGFSAALVPRVDVDKLAPAAGSVEVVPVRTLSEALDRLALA